MKGVWAFVLVSIKMFDSVYCLILYIVIGRADGVNFFLEKAGFDHGDLYSLCD